MVVGMRGRLGNLVESKGDTAAPWSSVAGWKRGESSCGAEPASRVRRAEQVANEGPVRVASLVPERGMATSKRGDGDDSTGAVSRRSVEQPVDLASGLVDVATDLGMDG